MSTADAGSLRAWVPATLLAASLLPGASLAAQEEAWDVTATGGDVREIDFITEEGTCLSVDVSPDGSWMVFDLLGHVYRAPIDGGPDAVSPTQETGAAMSYQPRISPDGTTIAFISDRGGQDSFWLMDADGSDPRPVFENHDVRASLSTWTPDGRYLLVDRSYVGPGRGEGQGEGGAERGPAVVGSAGPDCTDD